MREQLPMPQGEDYLNPLRERIQQLDGALLENLHSIKVAAEFLGQVAWSSYRCGFRDIFDVDNSTAGLASTVNTLLAASLQRSQEYENVLERRLEYSRLVAIAKYQHAEMDLAASIPVDEDIKLFPVEFEIRRTAQEDRKIKQLQDEAKEKNYSLTPEEVASAWHAIMDMSCEEQIAFLKTFGFIHEVQTSNNFHVRIWRRNSREETAPESGIITKEK